MPDPPDYLRQDMTVSVDIEVAAKDDALVAAVRAVHDVLSGAPWVLGIKDGRAVKQPVTLGLRGNTECRDPGRARRGRGRHSPEFRRADRPARAAVSAMNRWLPFEWIAAVRFLREGRLQTLFIIGGIAIGVGVIVFMSAMLAGLEANFIKRVLTSQPQIQLLPPDQVARPLRNARRRVRGRDRPAPEPASALDRPMAEDPRPDAGHAGGHRRRRRPCRARRSRCAAMPAARSRLSGIEPDSYFKIVRVPDYIVAGEPRLTSEDIIIGIELAKDLGATVGDKLNVQAASGANRVLTITGLVDLGNKGVNQRTPMSALRTAQSLLGMIGGVTTIDITVQDIYAAETSPSGSRPPMRSRPTAGSRPTRSSSPPSRRRRPPTP